MPAAPKPNNSTHWLPSTHGAATSVKKPGALAWLARSAARSARKRRVRITRRTKRMAYSPTFSQKRMWARMEWPAPLTASETMPVAITTAKMFGGRLRTLGPARLCAVGPMSLPRLLEIEDSPQQQKVEPEASQARQRRRPDDRGIPAQPGVHRRRQQPQLQHHQEGDEQVDATEDRRLLRARQSRF